MTYYTPLSTEEPTKQELIHQLIQVQETSSNEINQSGINDSSSNNNSTFEFNSIGEPLLQQNNQLVDRNIHFNSPPPTFDEAMKYNQPLQSMIKRILLILTLIIGFFILIIIFKTTVTNALTSLGMEWGIEWLYGANSFGPASTLLKKGYNGAVATENVLCSRIGTDILKLGGNAVDSAIAGALCIGVVNSFSSGIGGGGFMNIRTKDGTYDFIDFREEAPMLTRFEEYLIQPNKTQFGGTAVGIPGELRGFELAHKKYGQLPWKQLFLPSIKLARDGFPVGTQLAHYLKTNQKYIFASEAFREIFIDAQGKLVTEGQIIYRKNLATTLEIISNQGVDVFYSGSIAKDIISAIQKDGGHMTLEDLSSYQAIIREPLIGEFLGSKVITSPPPTSGAILLSILNIMEDYPLNEITHHGMVLKSHRLIEAFKFGYAQRTELADPKMKGILERVQTFIDKDTAKLIRKNISDTQTYDYKYYNPRYLDKDLPGTTHLSVIDKQGMAVGLTSTVNLIFGSKLMDSKTGIIFNNQLDDFGIPHTKNGFDLYPSPANLIAPRKRPLSSTVPTIFETLNKDGELGLLVIGGSGGSRILTATLQVVLQVLVNKLPLHHAVDTPRLHHQLLPQTVYFEPKFCSMISESLSLYGHNITYLQATNSVIQVAQLKNLKNGSKLYFAASDGRKHGIADTY